MGAIALTCSDCGSRIVFGTAPDQRNVGAPDSFFGKDRKSPTLRAVPSNCCPQTDERAHVSSNTAVHIEYLWEPFIPLADVGLVGDLFKAVPELTEKLSK
jgi:hypothetical protein